MANPTSGWDKVPVFGTYKNLDGTPKAGRVKFTIIPRIVAVDGTVITPGGGTVVQDLNGSGMVSVNVPANDDPDVTPNAWTVKVDEELSDGSGSSYFISPSLLTLPDGINLGKILLPQDGGDDAAALIRGVPGGVAALNGNGDVVNAAGTVIAPGGGSGGTPDDASVTNAKVATGAGILLSKTADDTASAGRLALTNAERTKLASAVLTSDSRLSDTRTPTASSIVNSMVASGAAIDVAKLSGVTPSTRQISGHPLTADISLVTGDITGFAAAVDARIAAAAGVTIAQLSGGVLPDAQLPPLAISEFLGASATQTAMLALTGQKGDWTIRTDLGTVFIISGTTPSSIGSWTQVAYPTAPVTTVAGRAGAVTLAVADVSGAAPTAAPTFTGVVTASGATSVSVPSVAGTTDSTNKAAPTSFVQAVAALLAPLASPTFTGTVTMSGAGSVLVPTITGTTDSTTKAAPTSFVQAVAALKANVDSPTLTGDPKAPTPATSDNDTSIATTAYVVNRINSTPVCRMVGSASAISAADKSGWNANDYAIQTS